MSDKKISANLNFLIYKTAIRSILLYRSETWPIAGSLVDKMASSEMRMLRYCLALRNTAGTRR